MTFKRVARKISRAYREECHEETRRSAAEGWWPPLAAITGCGSGTIDRAQCRMPRATARRANGRYIASTTTGRATRRITVTTRTRACMRRCSSAAGSWRATARRKFSPACHSAKRNVHLRGEIIVGPLAPRGLGPREGRPPARASLIALAQTLPSVSNPLPVLCSSRDLTRGNRGVASQRLSERP